MNWKHFLKPFSVQFAGQGVLLAVAWYWLSLGVGTGLQVGLNLVLALVLLVGASVVDAYGLGNWRNWKWALPAVALVPFVGYHFATMLLIPLLWLLVLLPSAAAGKWKLLAGPSYLLVAIGFVILMTVVPAALLNWIPKVNGLTGQALSFGGRALLAYVVAIGAWAALLLHIGKTVKEPEESLPA
ncbi:hypothetical protein [Bryobacter aggregatus]|uniref:hypothetical protein n=1 Tax=Bryobacter aggregatus TaxID=360054 RepID=UPI0004E20E67|nr:hypothetical protein [Bryobacter aggregatus]